MQSEIRNPKSEIRNHPGAAVILLAFIILAVVYSLVTPPFEAGDESRHYAVVKYMADTGHLPALVGAGEAQVHWSHEGNQPPLYYALAAAMTFWIDTGRYDDVFWYNPHTTIGNPLRPDNKNITIHPSGEGWPWRAHVLAVHLIRFLSIAMAAVSVTAAYAITLSLFRGNRWLAAGAMAITAFNPMFIFISASINNDNAVIMFITLALWLMVKVASSKWQVASSKWQVAGGKWQVAGSRSQGSMLHSPFRVAVLLGLLIGLGALSKLYALGLLPLAALLFLWIAYQTAKQDRTPGLFQNPKPKSAIRNPQGRCPQPTGQVSATHRASVRNPQPTGQVSAIRNPQSAIVTSFLTWTLIMSAVALAVAGWFYARNAVLYNGDILALQAMRDAAGRREEIPSLATIRAEFEGFRIAYWALFGGVNVLADDWIYTVLDWTSLAAVIGLTAFIMSSIKHSQSPIRNPQGKCPKSAIRNSKSEISPAAFAILLLWCLIMVTGFIIWNLTQPAGQGRLLYPAIAAISALGMLGLTWWLPPRGQKIIVWLCAIGLFSFALLTPFRYIAPAYAKPPVLARAELPPDLQPVNFTYDGKMRLIGYKLQAGVIRPAESLPLTLYWELVQPVDLNYSIFVHLLGRQRKIAGQFDSYPSGGKWPTTLLAPGDILADHYEIPIAAQAEFEQAPTRLLIAAGIYDLQEPGRPGKPATDAAGQTVEPIIASAKLIPWQWPNPPRHDAPINFFDKVSLLSHQIAAGQQSVTLNWQVNQPFDTDYTVFIQVWRAGTNEYAAGFDGPPVQGDYPTTLWAPGEIIVDTHPLDLSALPPGDYRLLAGLYNPVTAERLPAFGPDGPLPDYAVNLGLVKVVGLK